MTTRFFDRLANQGEILNTTFTGTQRDVEIDWPSTVPAFDLLIDNGVPVTASDPAGRFAQLRRRLYKCFIQGVWKDEVFWEHYEIFDKNFIVAPEHALVTVWHAYEQIRLNRGTDVPQLRIIMPVNHSVVVNSAAMLYTIS